MNYKFILSLVMVVGINEKTVAIGWGDLVFCSPSSISNSSASSNTEIFNAIYQNDIGKIKKILEDVKTCNQLNSRSAKNMTPLCYALSTEKNLIALYLIDKKADLKGAIFNTESYEIIIKLLEAGAKIDELNHLNQDLLAHILMRIKEGTHISVLMNIALELIRRGAILDLIIIKTIFKVNHLNGFALLTKALLNAFNKNNKDYALKVLKFCKDNAIALNRQDNEGNTLLHQLTVLEDDTIINRRVLVNAKVKLLLQYSPKELINKKNKKGDAPLHCAMALGDSALASLLVRYGANITVKNNAGISPWDFALNNPQFMDMLTRRGKTELIGKYELLPNQELLQSENIEDEDKSYNIWKR